MKKISVIALWGYCVIGLLNSVFAQGDVWQEISRGNLDLKVVLVDFKDSHIIYAGKKNGILKTEDGGETWKSILSIKGQNRAVNFLLFESADKNSLYAATGNGLFYSSNQGKHWHRISRGKDSFENECVTLTVSSFGIYLGTKAGLFLSKDNGRSWHKETGELGRSQILAIAYNLKEPDYIYVASIDGVFKTQNKGKDWEKIFIASPTENNNNHDEEEKQEDRDEEIRISSIRYITLDPNNLNNLYLATSRGVYQSQDRGQTWELLSSYGLLSQDVKFLLASPESGLYAVTKSGVFKYINERWHELSLGLVSSDIRFLAQDNSGNLYAACDNGLFKASLKNSVNDIQSNIVSFYSKDEPKIQQVQKAAIHYAEVEPDKIKEWRKKAKMKAILPKLTVGLDRSESTNYEIYTSVTTKYVYEGPQDKSNGWDVTLSWELGDLVWNNDQTSIDVRSRLMVQLRQDILDEVTKLYFERIRVKAELNNLTIEDRKKRFEKELKIQELTAMLDALTGGYFSSRTIHY